MSEFGYRPDIKKAVNLTGITALKSQLRINILALGIPTIIEGQTCGKDIICIFYPWFSFTSFDLSFAKKCPLKTINPRPIILTVVVERMVIIIGFGMLILKYGLTAGIDT